MAGRASSLTFVFSFFLFLSRSLNFSVYVCRPSRHRSPFALALFSGAAAAAAGRGSPPPPRGRACGASLGSVWVGGRSSKGVVNRGTGQGLGSGPGLRGLGFSMKRRHPAGGGRLGALGAVSSFVREVARWPVRSDNSYSKCGGAWRDKGPKLRLCAECW